MASESKHSQIVEFFKNSTIFLTGGTGFIGKVILSKLLLTCEVSRIYLLIRKKSSKSSTERMKELFEDQVFLHLKNNIPDCEDRIKLVEGDCSLENLGISAHDAETLCESVNFVMHCAAAMDMTGSFKKSVKINIQGTLDLITLANKMVKLKAFVHLSTLAAFWERDIIGEKLYESHLEYEDCLNLLKIDHVLPMDKHDEKSIVGKKLTYYSLTKAAAENIFIREKISVPVVIFRFGLAIPCWREPIPGWAGSLYGPSGLFAFALLDVAPAFYWSHPDTKLDLAPVDLIVNAMITITHYSCMEFQKKKNINEIILPFVYNYSTTKYKNSVTFEEGLTYLRDTFNIKTRVYYSKIIFILWCTMFGYIPALLTDFCAALFGKKIKLFRTYHSAVDLNLRSMRSNINFISIDDKNIQNCWKSLNDVDKRLFSFDLSQVIWSEYVSMVDASVRGYIRTLIETNVKMRLAVFWVPKIRFAFSVMYSTLMLYSISRIYLWFN